MTSRVLHVDDDADIRFLVQLALDQEPDLVLVSYPDGGTALAGAIEDPPDVALIDVMMPGMDGVTLASAFREHDALRDVPVVFVTARAYPEEIAHLRDSGAADVLVKPFDLGVLDGLIRGLLERREPG